MASKLLVVAAAALAREVEVPGSRAQGFMETVFPAVTCSAQASFRTGLSPAEHGMVGNGYFFKDIWRPIFWEQSARLVKGPRIWEDFRARGRRVAMLFWQQSLGEDVDMLLSPAPIHKHHGGMIESCQARPHDLYDRLVRDIGRPFRLRHYWGPLASPKAGDWIAEAAARVMTEKDLAPELILAYLPTMDYDLQRCDPEGLAAWRAVERLAEQLALLSRAAGEGGYDILVFGDYCIKPVKGPVFPNRKLSESGFFATRRVAGRLYPDFHHSRAFAVVDHEIAHVYVPRPGDVDAVAALLAKMEGVDLVLDREAQKSRGIGHENAGELVLTAVSGRWFAYPFWEKKAEAPDYAGHVDIHQKPGYDPAELFFGWPPGSVSQNPGRVKGSHGLAGEARKVFWTTTLDLPGQPRDLPALSGMVREHLKTI